MAPSHKKKEKAPSTPAVANANSSDPPSTQAPVPKPSARVPVIPSEIDVGDEVKIERDGALIVAIVTATAEDKSWLSLETETGEELSGVDVTLAFEVK